MSSSVSAPDLPQPPRPAPRAATPQPIAPSIPSTAGLEVPRVLGELGTATRGPTLLCIGGLHGNEPAGVLAARRVLESLEGQGAGLQGRLVVLAGNRAALRIGRRFIDDDLNRVWTRERIDSLRAKGRGDTAEERELLELDYEIQSVIDSSDRVFLLDLHSTSGPGPSFVVLNDTLSNREFGLAFPAPLVLGIEEELSGTLYQHLTQLGVTGITVETGSHEDPGTIDRAEAALWIALETAGILPAGDVRAESGRNLLHQGKGDLPDVVEVRYRHPLASGHEFRMEPGYAGFQWVSTGEALATDGRQEVLAETDGFLLMPLYQPQGEDGFFLVRAVHPAWLELSAVLRRLRTERFVHWLPGVHRDGDQALRFVVDRGVARWFALEIFHLLGFHREGPATGRQLVMVRQRRA